ncbi:NAD(P)-dependent alcohol dehydrogenase [Nocardia sp. CNY236]|uniref:NAD(P)-dependent alcohol dehydrogenase n=1 Tax=Nocardia sp. CNY236 TaxID=1169152 RepID=UPI0003FF2A4C|nr:NAD(P)-dependent alcohol dehydrogenase [Nocardia sp. CNY236]
MSPSGTPEARQNARPAQDVTDAEHTTAAPTTMKAVARHRYGNSDVLEITDVPVPAPAPGHVLVAVESAALNPLDWHAMTGTPWLTRPQAGIRKPTVPIIGSDFAGRVVTVGDEASPFRPGDEVFGSASQAYAEYVVAPVEHLVAKPTTIGFAEAAGLSITGVTALQGLRDKGELQPGQSVLVNGASGGVGTAAVQLAKWLGAEVTAVCSSRNMELVGSLGADHVVDYTTTDFTETQRRYDVVLDNHGNRALAACRGILTPTGSYVLVSGSKSNIILGPVARMLQTLLYFGVTPQRGRPFMASMRHADLTLLAELVASHHLRTVIDTVYPVTDIRVAMDHLATGHARGKIIVEL